MTPRLGCFSGRNRAGLFAASLVALAIYAVGAAGHFAHHLSDPDCDGGSGPAAHPCTVCVALHGGALSESRAPETLPARFLAARFLLPETPITAGATPDACAPRAPPLT